MTQGTPHPKPERMVRHVIPAMEILADQLFEVGDTVYHAMATAAVPGIVTGINIRSKAMTYAVTWGDNRTETYHLGIELTGQFSPKVVS